MYLEIDEDEEEEEGQVEDTFTSTISGLTNGGGGGGTKEEAVVSVVGEMSSSAAAAEVCEFADMELDAEELLRLLAVGKWFLNELHFPFLKSMSDT